MNWTTLMNSLTETSILIVFSLMLFFIVYHLQLWVLQLQKTTFVWNEAAAIYLGGSFIALSILLQAAWLTLHASLSMQGLEDSFLLVEGGFYQLVLCLSGLLVMVFLLIMAATFLFARFLTAINVYNDIVSNQRRSAILMGIFQIALTYALNNQIDLIFSSIFSTTNHATIF